MAALFLLLVIVVVLLNARIWWQALAGRPAPPLREEPFVSRQAA
jgi:hypothetical protein